MINVQNLVWMNVDDLCTSICGFGFTEVAAIEVCMSMKMVTRFGDPYEPVNGFESPVCLGIFIMDTERRRVCDENVHVTPIVDAVHEQARQHPKSTEMGARLGVLIRPVGAVLDASAQAADQECFEAYQFLVQV